VDLKEGKDTAIFEKREISVRIKIEWKQASRPNP
jgi:hypothetical protein